MERELDIRLAELNLLETACGIRMEKTGVRFGSELVFHRRPAHLVDYGLVRVGEKAVLSQGFIPQNFLEVVERGLRRQLNRLHRCCQIEQRGESSGLRLL